MSDPRKFEELPEELRRNVYSFLPMKERMRVRRVSKDWQKQTISGVTRIVFIAAGFEQPYGGLINYFHFARHNRVVVSNFAEIVSTLRQCLQVNQRLDSVKFVSLSFNTHNAAEVQALQAIGYLIANVTALEFHEVMIITPEQFQPLVAQVKRLEELRIDFRASVEDIHPIVQNVLNNNPNIKRLKLRDPHGSYPQLEVPQPLVSFHVGLRSRNVDVNLWISVRNNSGATLRVYKSEYFDGEQEKYLAFENLEDLRLANIRHQVSQSIVPSKNIFPRLRVLSLRFEEIEPQVDDMTWLFRQHQNLEILDVGVWFRNQNTLERIADSCPRLQHLSLYVDFDFTNFGVGQLLRLIYLRQLQLFGVEDRINDHQLVQVVPLPHLRALRVNCGANQMPESDGAFRAKAHADPGHLYFLRFRNNQLQEEPNVLLASGQCRNFFFSWGDMGPFGLYDYQYWERINRRMLNDAFGINQNQ